MSAVSVAVLAGVVVCGPVSIPFLTGVVTAVVNRLVDNWCSFKTCNTTLVAVGTVDGRALVSETVYSPACIGLEILDTVDAKICFKVAGTTFYSIIVTGLCIMAVCTQGGTDSGPG